MLRFEFKTFLIPGIEDMNFILQAVAKLPSLEPGTTGNKFFGDNIGLSKSVPSSLDRKQRYNDPDYAQVTVNLTNLSGIRKTFVYVSCYRFRRKAPTII